MSALSKLLSWLGSITMMHGERAYVRECQDRPKLTDNEFINLYYSTSHIPPNILLGVRRALAYQLDCTKLIPSDNLCTIFPDLDIAEVMYEIAEEFDVSVSVADIQNVDGSFDSIVQAIGQKLGAIEAL